MEELSALERQLIRSSLLNKTDMELAQFIEKPVQTVQRFIQSIWEGDTETRNRLIIEKRKDAEFLVKRKAKKVALKKESLSIRQQHLKRREAIREREQRKSFSSREIDYSLLKSVRVDEKTFIWIPKDQCPEDAIRQYEKNRMKYQKTTYNGTPKI